MRAAVRKAVFWALALPLFLLLPHPASAEAGRQTAPVETPAAFVERLEDLLGEGNLAAYLDQFAPELRPAERARLGIVFDDLAMTGVALRPAGIQRPAGGLPRVFVQAFFENDHSAVIESWTLALESRGEAWSVARLDVTGSLTRLYKVRVPAERAVRARRVEVGHADIRFTFTDAAVFYDNLPAVETALVVVGRGKVVFTPSDANERHQLELLYKRDRIEDEVESLFIRCSPGQFETIVIEADERGAPLSAAERDRAAAVFARNYPRSYTIESSIDGSLLSFLPQADEAVFEFKARRAGELAYIYYPFSEDEVSLYDRGRQRTICLYAPAETGSGPPLKRMFVSFAEKFDITSYALDLGFTPSARYLSAKARITIVPKVDLLENIRLRFNPELEILKITDAEGLELFYTSDKVRQILYVHFLSPPEPGAPASIDVYYRGRMVPATPTTDVIAQTGLNENIRIQPRYETFFYTHAGNWYPGPSGEDYFEARLTVSVPPEYKCVATGEMVASGRLDDLGDLAAIEKAGNAVYTFVSLSPVKYLSFIVGKFDKSRLRPGPVPVAVHVSSEVMDSRPAIADRAAAILDFYGRAFGPFPYRKLDIVLRLWPDFGGHSPASFIVLNEVPWLGDTGLPMSTDTPVDLSGWDDYFLAHEIAHQWWGQGVSFDSYRDQWLSEGLAQFAAASYLRHKHGDGAFATILKKFARWTERKSVRGPIIMGSRLSYFDFAAYQSIVYNKAALALFMLQDLVGREAFEAGLRSFFEANKYRAARTGEFIAAMEAASSRDLQEFFRGWFYSWELPDVRTAWTLSQADEGGVRLDVRVTQVKGRFIFPLWVEWRHAGVSRRELLVVDEATESATLLLPVRPDRVRINPDKAVPGKFD